MEENTGWEDMFKAPEIIPPTPLSKENAKKLIEDYIKGPERVNGIEKIHSPELLEELVRYSPGPIALKPFDRYGKCPHCKSDFDGGDIFTELCNVEALVLQGDSGKISRMYGWTEHDKKRFSKVIDHIVEIEGKLETFHECPVCHHVYEQQTSKEYRNMLDLKMSTVYNKPLEDIGNDPIFDDDPPF